MIYSMEQIAKLLKQKVEVSISMEELDSANDKQGLASIRAQESALAFVQGAQEKLGIKVFDTDLEVKLFQDIQRHLVIIQTGWRPLVHTVQLAGGAEDGKQLQVPWLPVNDPNRTIVTARLHPDSFYEPNNHDLSIPYDDVHWQMTGYNPDGYWIFERQK